MQYIPGFWFVSNTNSSLISSNNGEQYNWQMANVCQVYGMNDEQRQATIKLISAAPDLLEALTDLYNSIDSCIELTPNKLIKAKAAIEKATK